MASRLAKSGNGPKLGRFVLDEPSIFVASPGDVSQEREALKFWLEATIKARFGVRVYTYEHEEGGEFHSALNRTGNPGGDRF